MPSDSLPYTLFLILAELGLGGTIAMTALDLRGQVPRGFIKATVIFLPLILGLALWVAFTLDGEIVEGYRLDTRPRDAIVALLAAMTGLSLLHNLALSLDRVTAGRALDVLLSLLAVATLLLTALLLRLPVWNMGLLFFSLLAGSLAVGLAAAGLALGHSYLVTPRLSPRPLIELTSLLLVVIALQGLLLALALALPVDETPQGGRDRPLADDVTFWLRILVGIALPLLFGWMAWSSSRIRSMMAATGLLYLVTAAVLAGEIAARALLFDSARPI